MKLSDYKCPSYGISPNAELLGVTNSNGEIDFLGKPIKIDEDFIKDNESDVAIETKFRFTGSCANKSCGQWAENKCSLGANIVKELGSISEKREIPNCPIMENCRWFHQEGEKACRICPLITRNGMLATII